MAVDAFLAEGLCILTLTVSTLTVLWQSIRAADTSPVDALRKE